MTSKFTQEVQKRFNLLSTKQNIFDNCLADLGKQELSHIRPHDFLLALQNAGNCAQELDELVRSFAVENEATKKALGRLQDAHQQKGTTIRSNATSKASSIISDVSGFKDFAEQVEESVTSVSKLSADSVLSRTNYPVTGPSGFGSALSAAHMAKQEFKKDAFNSYARMAGWSAGGAAVISWITGVSFMAGLGIGGLVAGGIFVLYSSKKSAGAGAIRQLVSAAEAEFSSIAKEKLAEDTKAQKEYADKCRIEDERFQVVKTDFDKAKENIETALIRSLSKFQALSDTWQIENAALFDQSSNISSSGSSGVDGNKPSTSYALLGMTSFSATPIKQPSARATPTGATQRAADLEPIEGNIYRGKVTKIVDFGAFVNFHGKRDGLVHVSQIVDRRLNHPSDVLEEGQEVLVKLLGFDDRGKVRLSMKVVNQDTGEAIKSDEKTAEIKSKIDRLGQAEMIFDTAMEMFQEADSTQDGEKKREALLLLSSCVEQFPEYVKAHCVLGRALLFLDDTEEATKIVSQAYEIAPDDPAVCSAYASCFVKKGSDLWDSGDMNEAFDAFMLSLKVNGFELQSFAASRHLARETDQLSRWARECVELGIDPLKEVDVSELGPK